MTEEPRNYNFRLTWEEAQKIIDCFDDTPTLHADLQDISGKLSEQLKGQAERPMFRVLPGPTWEPRRSVFRSQQKKERLRSFWAGIWNILRGRLRKPMVDIPRRPNVKLVDGELVALEDLERGDLLVLQEKEGPE